MKLTQKPEFNTENGRYWIQNALIEANVLVYFTKKDGSVRKMKCTLMESAIPPDKKPKSSKKLKTGDSIAVFDLEQQDWRSFRFDSVKDVTVL
jgi:hypothetical protein